METPRYLQGFRQTPQQQMRLLPRMLQSVEVLQLPALELEGFLAEAVAGNEALRFREPGEPLSGPAGDGRAATERHGAWLESQPAAAPGLEEALLAELACLGLESGLEAWSRFVVGALDADGLLRLPDETLLLLAREEGLSGGARELGLAIAVVQGLEPRGVGGRDVREALLLQLDPGDPDYTLLCRLVEECLEELGRDAGGVARALGIDPERLEELVARLRRLAPAPAGGVSGESSPVVRPDVAVEPRGEGFEVRVLASGLPPVEIDGEVRDLAGNRRLPEDVRSYFRGKLEKARWIVAALEERQRTLLRIATAVFEQQRLFLREGPRAIRPLRMGEVAGMLGIHVSTVSRGMAGKYAETPWGVLPLRAFFPAEAGGRSTATRDQLADAVRAVVAEEDPARPLSDEEIQSRLEAEGWRLARRTVAKYRKELGIPSSYRRPLDAGRWLP